MLDLASAETRIAIANARRQAMTGHEQVALDRLGGAFATTSDQVDKAAILLTKAELLYLAGKYKASFEVFGNELDALVPNLPHSVALVVGFNRCDVAMSLFDSAGTSRFYDLVDEQHIAGIEHWDDSAMLSATRSAERGRSYESLPTIWRELLRTYRQGRWAAFRQASRYMADECVRVGLPHAAAFHAAVALDTDCAKHVAVTLLNSRNVTAVEATITKLLLTANLQSHFAVACEVFQTLTDAIPDSLVDRVIS